METAAIIGAGAAGLLHALAFRAHGVKVVQIYDPSREKAEALAALCDARVVEGLDAVATDIVSICSPPRMHVEQAMRFPDRIVFVEKPVACSLEELAVLETHPRCIPVVQWRAGRAIRAVRAAIGRGMLGASPSVAIDLAWSRDAAYHAARADWGCGALLSVGIHAVDAVLWAIGAKPIDAFCMRNEDEETEAVLAIRFQSGALASLRLTFHAGPDRTRISFAGNGITAVIEGGEADPTASRVHWSPAAPRLLDLEVRAGGYETGPLIVPFIGDALRALRGRDRSLSISDVRAAHTLILGGDRRKGDARA